MTDVDGIRNLLGTGLIEFAGGILTGAAGPRSSAAHQLAAHRHCAGDHRRIRHRACARPLGTIRPIFRERGKINAEVTGRLTESLGGVRVVKGYHAEAREEAVFEAGVQRLLNNVLKSLTATSVMSLSATVLMGMVGAIIMYVGARQITAHVMTLGDFFAFTAYLAFLIAPMIQIVKHRNAAHRGAGRIGAHARSIA